MGSESSQLSAIIVLSILAVMYMVPGWIAYGRKHHNANAIITLNLLLGWTALGWIAALVWSLTEVKQEDETQPVEIPTSDSKTCPFCAEVIKAQAKVCKHCGRDLSPAATEPQKKEDTQSVGGVQQAPEKAPAVRKKTTLSKDEAIALAKKYGITKVTGGYSYSGEKFASFVAALQYAHAVETAKKKV